MLSRSLRRRDNACTDTLNALCFQDLIVIFTSSCARVLPRRQGYNHLPSHGRGGRGSRADDENRLIDQLDEEWDD